MKGVKHKINKGSNVLLIDTQGDIFDDILNLIPDKTIEENRLLYLDFSNKEGSIGLNIFDVVNEKDFDESVKFLLTFFGRYDSIFNLKKPELFQEIFINLLYTIHNSNISFELTIYNISLFLNSEDYRAFVISFLDPSKDIYLLKYWEVYETAYIEEDPMIISVVRYITKTLNIFDNNDLFKILSQNESTIDFNNIENKTVICNIPREILGENSTDVLTEFILFKLRHKFNSSNIYVNGDDLPINFENIGINFIDKKGYESTIINTHCSVDQFLKSKDFIELGFSKNYTKNSDIVNNQKSFTKCYTQFASGIV